MGLAVVTWKKRMFEVAFVIVWGLIYLACWLLPFQLSTRIAMRPYGGWLRFLVVLLCSVLAAAICFVSTITVFAYDIAPAGTFMETLFIGIGLSIWATMRGEKRVPAAVFE